MANIDLLDHEINRFGVVTVADAVMYDILSGAPVLKLDTLKISNISSESQNKQIKGGQFADMLAYYAYGRSVNVEFQDALISDKSMTELWGADVSSAAFDLHQVDRLEAVADGTDVIVTLKRTPKTGSSLIVLNVTKGTELALTTGYTIDGEVITSVLSAIALGDVVEVYYTVNSADLPDSYNPTEMILKSTSFPRTVKFVGTSFVLEQKTGQRVAIEIEIPKLKLDGAFALTLEAEGDASVFDFKGMALINEKRELIKIRTIGYLD